MTDDTMSRPELLDEIQRLRQQVQSLERERDDLALLARENDYYQYILDHLTEGVLLTRMSDNTIVYVNPAFEQMFGYEQGEIIGQEVTILDAPETTIDHIISALKSEGQWQGEILNITKQGHPFWCYVGITIIQHPRLGEVSVSIRQNIDTQKRVFELQQESKALYLSLVETLPFQIYRIDLQGRITFVNRALQEALGIPFEHILGKTAYDFYPKELADKYSRDNQSVFDTGKVFTGIEQNRSPMTGQINQVQVTKIPIYDNQGNMSGIQGVFEDVTARIEAENHLKSSRIALERLIQQIPIGIQVFDTTGLCTNVNMAHLEIFGVNREDLVDQYNIFEDPLAVEMKTASAARLALEGKTVHLGDMTFNFENADARFVNIAQAQQVVNVTIFPIFDHANTVTSFVGLNMNVTRRKQFETQLQMSEKRYRAIVEDQQELMSRLLPDGSINFANEAFAQFFGLSPEEIMGMKWQDIIHPEILPQVQEQIDRVTPTNPANIEDYQLRDANDDLRWIQWMNRGFFDEDGQIIEYQGIGIDVTEKKLLEQQRFDFALEKERTQILSDFVVKIAHEFRTPLSIINSSAYAMTRMATLEQREERMKRINYQVEHITQLIDTLILMSRLDSGMVSSQQETVNINHLIEIAYLRLNFDNKSVGCEMHLSEDALYVRLVQKDFVRAIQSVCENALKYTNAGGKISIRSWAEDEHALIAISDNGKGISSEALPHIFNRFFRQDTSGKTPGLGLGLPIAKALLQQFDGTIDVESEEGIGTTFIIKLKRAELGDA